MVVENGYGDGSGDEWKKDQPDENEAAWTKTGLLEGLSSVEKNKLVPLLTELSELLVKHKDVTKKVEDRLKCDEGFVAGTLIPVCRRLVDLKVEKLPDAEWMLYDYCGFLIREIKSFKTPPNDKNEIQICEWYSIKLQKKQI